MSPEPRTFRRNVCLVAALAVAARLAIAAASWRAAQSLSDAALGAARGQEVLGALEGVRASLARAQACELSFLLTGHPSDRAAFEESERAARQGLGRSWTLAADEAGVQAALTAAAKAVDRRFELDGVAQAARAGRLNAQKARVVAQVSADATEAAWAAIDRARAAQSALTAERESAAQRATARSLTGIGVTAVASIALIVAFALWLLPAFDARVAERDSLRPDFSRAKTRL